MYRLSDGTKLTNTYNFRGNVFISKSYCLWNERVN